MPFISPIDVQLWDDGLSVVQLFDGEISVDFGEVSEIVGETL